MPNIIKREVLIIEETELIRPPLARQLVTGKQIVVFNIILTGKTRSLNTGHQIDYRNDVYEIMNREAVESPVGYTKFNCVRAANRLRADQPAAPDAAGDFNKCDGKFFR